MKAYSVQVTYPNFMSCLTEESFNVASYVRFVLFFICCRVERLIFPSLSYLHFLTFKVNPILKHEKQIPIK